MTCKSTEDRLGEVSMKGTFAICCLLFACVTWAACVPSTTFAANLPTSHSGLRLWLKADDLLATNDNGDSLGTWADSSGLTNDASTTGGRVNPVVSVGNLPNVFFSGAANQLMVSNDLFGGVSSFGDVTVFSVYQSPVLNSLDRPVGFGARDTGNAVDLSDNFNVATDPSIRYDNGSVSTGYTQPHPTTYFTRSTVMNSGGSGSVDEFFDFTSAVANVGGNNTPSKDEFYLGDLRDPTAGDASIAEVIVYDRALSTAERQQVEGYLQSKYYSSAYLRFEEGTVGAIAPGGTGSGPADYTVNDHSVSSAATNPGMRPVFSADVATADIALTGSVNNVSLDFERDNGNTVSLANDPTISFGDSGSGAQAFTMEAFVKFETLVTPGTTTTRQYLVHKKSDSGVTDDFVDYGIYFRDVAGSPLTLILGDGSSNSQTSSTLSILDNDWHYVSVAFDPDSDTARFIIDDQIETITGITFTPQANSGQLTIGGHYNSSGVLDATFDGLMDELRITPGFLPTAQLLTAVIPEPETYLLSLVGLIGAIVIIRRRRK